jgi:hypothetical protein
MDQFWCTFNEGTFFSFLGCFWTVIEVIVEVFSPGLISSIQWSQKYTGYIPLP